LTIGVVGEYCSRVVNGLLDGVRVIEVAMFAPDATGMHLADLGAEVIKVEPPGIGDPARLLGVAWRGESPATRRWNRGKRSITLDLRVPAGVAVFLELAAGADAVIEGMRPGALARRGLGPDELRARNPRLVYAAVSGWGRHGPYRDLGSHGLAFDAYAGLAAVRDVDGRPARPSGHVWHGLEAGPLHAALAIVAGILRARASGLPSDIEVSQADAAVAWNSWRVAYEAAVAEHGTEPANGEARELIDALEAAAEGAGQAGAKDRPGHDVRYQYYAAADGHVLLMATERRFWHNFCTAIGRVDLYARWPGRAPADHDYGNDELRDELARVFASRTRAEWVQLFLEHDVAGSPVYAPGETHRDPHFVARDMWLDPAVHGLRLLGPPVRVDGDTAVADRAAPSAGQDTDEVLRRVLGYDDAHIAACREAGAFGDTR
jgi:crotonobetainyl-CoA:carnitine CoA-transferase CaiB-like acyl-CoA transferase